MNTKGVGKEIHMGVYRRGDQGRKKWELINKDGKYLGIKKWG